MMERAREGRRRDDGGKGHRGGNAAMGGESPRLSRGNADADVVEKKLLVLPQYAAEVVEKKLFCDCQYVAEVVEKLEVTKPASLLKLEMGTAPSEE